MRYIIDKQGNSKIIGKPEEIYEFLTLMGQSTTVNITELIKWYNEKNKEDK